MSSLAEIAPAGLDRGLPGSGVSGRGLRQRDLGRDRRRCRWCRPREGAEGAEGAAEEETVEGEFKEV